MRRPFDKRLAALILTLLLVLTVTQGHGAVVSLGSRGNMVAHIQQRLKEWGYYKIELQTQTICNNETVSTTIEIEEPIVITLTQPNPLCANIPDEYNQNPYTLIAAPTDGKWTWKEAVPSEQLEYLDADNQLFYPNQPGTYALTYTVQRKACTAQESLEIIVKDYPSLEIGEDIYVCEKDQTPVLLEANPNNGVWTGNEVSVADNKYYFNPPLTVGSYNLTYTITDAFGCKNRDYKQAHIKPLPKTDFSPEQHCLPDPITFTPVVDVNTHQFYVNYGDGTEGSDLTHLYDNIGIYDVKLIVSAPNGCVDSLTKSVLVEKFPDQKIIMDKKTGCSPFTPTIELEFDYIDPNTTFTWDFGQYGRQFTEQPTAVTFTAEEEDVTYYFDVTVKNICGEYTVRDSVRVLALAKAGVIPSVERGCSPVEVEFKNVSKGSIQRMQYTWDFGDGSEREHGFQASHTFTTTMDKDSTYTVMLIAENACGIDTTYQDIYVIPPVVFPQIIAKNQTGCVGEDICVLNKTMEVTPHHEIITYHWDYGNGAQSDNPTDTCTVFNAPGEYTIKLTITTSCGSSETDEAKVKIYDLPKFNISAVDYICRKDTVFPRIEILSDIREVEWDFGTGDKSNMMQPKYGYAVAGEYTITATATENNFAACKASKNIPLLVRELPNPIITPLEVDSCSPFTYRPIVHDEEINYTIDYENDGFRNANTTHTYVNTSLEPAIYQTKFYLEDKYGCKSNNHGVVTIYPEPIATITIAEVTEARPEVVTFANNSYGANYCKWTLPYRGITETCNDVQEYYYDNILKTTYLEVANEYGCTDKDSIDHQPLMKGLYFPNTFAPNGVTEENRTFNGVGIGLKEYRLEIFDLFGNLIYYTTSLDDKGCPNQGWDGRDQHGNMMPQDVYTWKAEAVFIDGSVYTFGNDYNNIPGTEVNDVNLHRGSVLLLHR
jgi:PKD repeat protein